MSKQNVYDEPAFHQPYQQMRWNGAGINEAVEQPAINALLPPLDGLVAVDLGAGDATFACSLIERGARYVVAIDPSERMLASARAHPFVGFVRAYAEGVELKRGSVDLVVSSLALHYVEPLTDVIARIAEWLTPGGTFVMSIEHPIMTAVAEQRWCEPATGASHWPVDNYDDEGPRSTSWFISSVIKYHRRTNSIINTVLDAGLRLVRVLEPAATSAQVKAFPHLNAHAADPQFSY